MKITERKQAAKMLTRIVLFIGIVYLGFIFPNSFSDHERLLHFAAHVGMSFLLACCVYVICNVRLRINKARSYIILLVTIFIVGSLYKYFEIAGEGMLRRSYSFGQLLTVNGYYASMSLNFAGALGAILLIGYVADNQQMLLKRLRRVKASPPSV